MLYNTMKNTVLLSLFLFLSVFAFSQTEPLFYESFDKCLNDDELYDGFTGGNDNLWSGNIATEIAVFTDNDGWTMDNVFGANQCIKLGTSSLQGKITTPAIACTGDATLTFRAAPWNEEKTFSVTVSVKGGTADKTSFTLDKHWNDITVQLTDITEAVSITFSTGSKKQRVFIDEIRLMPADPNKAAIRVKEGTTVDYGYLGRYYSSVNRTIEVKGENLSSAGIKATIESDADNLFSVSPANLPAEGGVLTITCKSGAYEGMHGAYLVLSGVSKYDSQEKTEKTVTLVMEVSGLDLQGSGTKEDPYTVSDRLLLADNDGSVWSGTMYWVTGYVLGAAKRYNDKFDGICSNDKLSIVLADSPTETDMNKVITVQIGGEARDALNVVDNPELLGKQVKVQGTLLTDNGSPLYLGKAGVRDVNYHSQYVLPDDIVSDIETITENNNLPMYDVLGRRVGKDYKGVVIIGNKKFIVR